MSDFLGPKALTATAAAAQVSNPATPLGAALTASYASPRFARPQPFRASPQVTLVTTFQTGHGWAANTGTWTVDTTDYALGSQSIRTTVSSGSSASFRDLALAPADMSGRDFAVLVKVDTPVNLDAIQLYLGTSSMANFQTFKAAGGGASANSTILPDVWTWVYFTWADTGAAGGTLDPTVVTDWQVRAAGSTATPVNVWVNAVGHYPRRQAFPNGCVSFACDDGRLSQYTRMAPQLDKYGYGATAYLIVESLGTANKMTYDQVKELENYHRWEIAGHSYTTAAHNNGMGSLTLDALDTEMRNLRNWLQQGNHKGSDLFAYPLGQDNADIVEVTSRYFTNARQIVRAPFQNADLDQPYRMRSNSISSSDSIASAKSWIDKTIAGGAWLTITMHDIVDGTPAAGTEWNTADWNELVDYVAASGVEVMPVGAALDRITANQPVPPAAPINGGTP